MSTMSVELPSDPKAVKKMEMAIAKEAQADEKDYKRALKELKGSEKSEAKAAKAAGNADKNLKKMEDREHNTIKLLQKATHNHDQALTSLHTAQSDVQIQKQQAERSRHRVDTLKVRADELFKAKQIREEERSRKLQNLHSTPPDPNRTTATTG
ncbi:hypothetical protein HD554DRAFT_140869 [Boletus coccyginus]|nr:hypothetical protein HD554DRAFT_140869 [Boletus coccyginus]